jgi:hypothetical protein
MNVNSIVGSFVGLIAYADQNKGAFHAQVEAFGDDVLNWTIDQQHSETHVANLHDDATYKSYLTNLFDNLPFVSSFSWNNAAGDGKEISDVVLHLTMLVTFDDETTYPVSVTVEKGERRFHTSSATDVLSSAGNKAATLTKIENMLEQIIDTVTIS